MLRRYCSGDENKITPTPETAEFFDKDKDYFSFHLQCDETYTCYDSEGNICGIMCFSKEGDNVYDTWALFDIVYGAKMLRDCKKLVDLYHEKGNMLYTVSLINGKQTKLHEFLGYEAREIENGGKQVWVRL